MTCDRRNGYYMSPFLTVHECMYNTFVLMFLITQASRKSRCRIICVQVQPFLFDLGGGVMWGGYII